MGCSAGRLHKMSIKNSVPLDYSFVWQEQGETKLERLNVNQFLGKNLSLRFTGKINCIACDRSLNKTFQQGYCFPCANKLAACDLCILRPQTCHFHLGSCREPEWGLAHCFVPHIVYLANSSGLKVGITRETQVPTRWFDQGASQALAILRVQSKYQAGLLEVEIAKLVCDKTDWRKLLLTHAGHIDLEAARDKLLGELSTVIQQIAGKFKFGDIEILTSERIQQFEYPILEYPSKIISLSFDKSNYITGILLGIKGQYLILDTGVINIRKFTGYEVILNEEA